MLDLDKFKQINDTLGHACGDQLLCAVAKRLNALVDGAGLVARLSGDEFAIVISGADVADRAQKSCRNGYRLRSAKSLFPSANASFASTPASAWPFIRTIARRRTNSSAMPTSRCTGPRPPAAAAPCFFERAIRDELEARLSLEAELRRAVDRKELELFYQPQVGLDDGRLMGAEALIRWRHPVRGLVSPADFMPLVHASSISGRIALWVMETACRQGRLWQQQGHDVRLGVNLSPSQLQSGDLATTVATVLKDTGYSPFLLELEVTENILLEDDEGALETFHRIQDLGVSIAFDDFGTGYASLTYLKKFPLDRLKIDKSFVSEFRADSDDAAIVGSTINLGKLLGPVGHCRGHRGSGHRRPAEEHGVRGRAGAIISAAPCRRRNSSSDSWRAPAWLPAGAAEPAATRLAVPDLSSLTAR